MDSDPTTSKPDPPTTRRSETSAAEADRAGRARRRPAPQDPTPTSSGNWLTMPELAAELRQSMHTLYKWSRRGYPHFPLRTKLPNGEILVARGDLDAWMEGRRR
jgi:predicted DNA-binding transcriptional regulator AlpA